MNEDLFKVLSWYRNHSSVMVRTADFLARGISGMGLRLRRITFKFFSFV